MLSRICLKLLLSLALLALLAPASPAAPAADPAEDATEAKRLYENAQSYVSTIGEGPYSYAYIQFHWKRAQANIERILRLYPATPTGRGLATGQLKLGEFELTYFRDRVLYRLEEKRVAAFDAVNCAIFLYNFEEKRWDDTRRAALGRILEVLSRQQRWAEALKFPVLDTDKAFKAAAIFRVAARFEVNDMVKKLLAVTPKADLPATQALLGEALALRGRPRTEITELLDQDSADIVKLGVLAGMIEREVAIQRGAALRLDPKNIILAGGALQRPEIRDDIFATAKTFFPSTTAASTELVDAYRAALGTKPALSAPVSVHLAYLDYLSAFEKFEELETYAAQPSLPSAALEPLTLKTVELYAQAGRAADAARHRTPFLKAGGALAQTVALAEFRGQMHSTEVRLTVQPNTFSTLPISDPCVLAQAIMEWSLTPNRSIRGAAPYDSVVQKFQPGFTNIPAPKSDEVRDASSALKPY
jgi:hypothetical protein